MNFRIGLSVSAGSSAAILRPLEQNNKRGKHTAFYWPMHSFYSQKYKYISNDGKQLPGFINRKKECIFIFWYFAAQIKLAVTKWIENLENQGFQTFPWLFAQSVPWVYCVCRSDRGLGLSYEMSPAGPPCHSVPTLIHEHRMSFCLFGSTLVSFMLYLLEYKFLTCFVKLIPKYFIFDSFIAKIFFFNFIGWHWLTIYRFQVCSSVTHHLSIALCVHHP